MATQFAYPRFDGDTGTPPRLCGILPPVAPRQNRRFSLPRIAFLVEPSDDEDDEETLLSYHSLHWKGYKRAHAPSPDNHLDDLEKRVLVSPFAHDAAAAAKNKPVTNTSNNLTDYYVAPLSPLSDLTDSDTSDSDSDDQVESKPTKNQAEKTTGPHSKPPVTPCTDARSPSPGPSIGLKRKRSCANSERTTTSDTAGSAVKDSEGPSKRRRRTSGSSSEAEQAESSTAARRGAFSMSREEITKKNIIRRPGTTFGTVRKPRVIQASISKMWKL